MKHRGKIESVADFLEMMESIAPLLKKEQTKYFFRGQPSTKLILRPKIGRWIYTENKTLHNNPVWRQAFNHMFSHFEREYIAHYPRVLERKIDRLSLAQHYGLATQLLDWTLNPLVSLYFACDGFLEEDGIVFSYWGMSQSKVITEDNDLEKDEDWQIFRPLRFDQRMVNQDTVFTYHHSPTKDFGEYLGDACNGAIIPARKKKSIIDQLSLIGVHKAFIYPGLESTCQKIEKGFVDNKGINERHCKDHRKPYLELPAV